MEEVVGQVGQAVQRERERCGMSRAELARLTDYSPQSMWYLETGKIDIKLSVLARIARVLDMDLAGFFRQADPQHKDPRKTPAILLLQGLGLRSTKHGGALILQGTTDLIDSPESRRPQALNLKLELSISG
jgi:transcriptional regulator with XRE-family HTH domain